jgi:hypothetical protein
MRVTLIDDRWLRCTWQKSSQECGEVLVAEKRHRGGVFSLIPVGVQLYEQVISHLPNLHMEPIACLGVAA